MPIAEPPEPKHALHSGAREVKTQTLTVVIVDAGDGWFAARIDGAPGVFGQGRTVEEARRDVLSALHDVTWEPTLPERLLYRLRSLRVELRDRLLAH